MATNGADDSIDPTHSPTRSPTISPTRSPPDANTSRSRASSGSSGILRKASVKFLESGPPLGVWHAAGEALGKAPTPNDIVKGKYSHDGWDAEAQYKHSLVGEDGARRLPRRMSSGQTSTTPATPRRISSSQVPTTPASPSALPAHVETDETDQPNEPFSPFSATGNTADQIFGKTATRPATSVKDIAPDVKDDMLLPPNARNLPTASPPEEKSTPLPLDARSSSSASLSAPSVIQVPDADGVYPNGYKFPPKHTRAQAAKIGFKAFCKYVTTILGFLVVVYCLNIVAWGGMLFLLLVGGGDKYMCYPERLRGVKDCNDLYAPRRIWLEIASQILNALFCVTGLGLIPWRFRDLYYLLQWRLFKKQSGLRKLGGIHNGWFRLPGSHHLPIISKVEQYADRGGNDHPAMAIPLSKTPPPPLTGNRAPDTKTWKLDFVIWAMVLNTFLQIVLCGFMWGYSRFNRPSWATGTFIALACIVAAAGGLMTFFEAKKVKAVEGIPVEGIGEPKDAELGKQRDRSVQDGNEKKQDRLTKQQDR